MTILYFGIYRSDFGRNQVYIGGLRKAGHTVIECYDYSPGFLKFPRLYQKHRAMRGKYDVLVVGCYGHAIVPFARLITKQPIIADLVGLLEDVEYHSHTRSAMRRMKNRLIDWLAILSADLVLVESEAQKIFCIRKYGRPSKFSVLYTGTDEASFYCNSEGQNSEPYNILFRGRLTPESGIETVLGAAKLLKENRRVNFCIIGYGYRLQETKSLIEEGELKNVELISEHLDFETLRSKMCQAYISIGQVSDNPRLSRAIPHKAFESMHMGLPYVSAPGAIQEILEDNISCVIVPPNDPEGLAHGILTLIDNPFGAATMSAAAKRAYDGRVSQHVLGMRLAALAQSLLPAI